ncbi:hypothetical protein TI39_contig5817g00024 [Zymoseptoria brevis]|uniref:HNH nuclease domain-containing protein n=1 Tax=Zymoseptoria brevis TaxID=1047168 RepID=A0A0F4G6C2_9PEZI|nr:hypothetical protein TI39_contig5817g00024 [Zymoseptoria brevis]
MSGPGVTIPTRTSSLRKSSPRKRIAPRDFDEEARQLRLKQKDSVTSLKSYKSYGSEYWRAQAESEDLKTQQSQLCYEQNFGAEKDNAGSQLDPNVNEQDLLAQIETHQGLTKLLKNYARKMDSSFAFPASVKQAWISLFTTSPQGLGYNTAKSGGEGGGRDSSTQSNMRKETEKEYGTRHPDARKEHLQWCCVTREYWPAGGVKAAHLFPFKHGPVIAKALFPDHPSDEIDTAKNCLILSEGIEKYWDQHLISFVPDVSESSVESIQAWSRTSPKEYKIHIHELKAEALQRCCGTAASELTFVALHGMRVKFLNDFRPSTRFLVFQDIKCRTLALNKLKSNEKVEAAKREFGKTYWGSMGAWIKHSMMVAHVESLGGDFPRDPADICEEEVDDQRESGFLSALIAKETGPKVEHGDEDDDGVEDGTEDG